MSTTAKQKRKEPFFKRVLTLRSGSDSMITMAMIGLMIFGSIMVVSTNLGSSIGQVRTIYMTIAKQALFCTLGWLVCAWLSRLFSYNLMARILPLFIFVYFLLLVATAVIGTDINGSKAWIQVGSLVSLQPSEFGKPLLILALALSARRVRDLAPDQRTFFHIFAWPLVLMALSVVFVGGLQKDFGSLIITLGIGFVGIMVPSYEGVKKWQRWLVGFFILVMIFFIVGVYLTDWFVEWFRNVPILRHIAVRIANMKNPYLNIHDDGYQPANALYGIADGGLLGRGLGSSVRKYGFLTQAESDYILAIVIEETGILGLGLILLLYGIIIWRLLHWALHARGTADKILFTCTASYLMLHFIVNIGGVSTLIPMTGVPLLLISAGGSSQLAVCIALGMVQARIAAIRPRIEILQDIKQKSRAAMDEYHSLQSQ